jgi:formamidopyrimidine-DNA glycosylase
MAEGHTIHALARRVRQLTGEVVRSSSPTGAFPDAAGLDGARLLGAEAFGKNLLVRLARDPSDDDVATVHVHLGMTGLFSVRRHRRALGPDGWPRTEPPFARATTWRLLTPTFVGDLSAPTTCALLDEAGVLALLARLGPDPLRPDSDPEAAFRRIRASTRPIGTLLTDQRIVAGIGNVYRAEILFRMRLSPFRRGREVPDELLERLWDDAAQLLALGADAGWIVTHPAQVEEAAAYVERGERVPRWAKRYFVYGRAGQACLVCGTRVEAQRLGLQRIFWCPVCQAT